MRKSFIRRCLLFVMFTSTVLKSHVVMACKTCHEMTQLLDYVHTIVVPYSLRVRCEYLFAQWGYYSNTLSRRPFMLAYVLRSLMKMSHPSLHVYLVIRQLWRNLEKKNKKYRNSKPKSRNFPSSPRYNWNTAGLYFTDNRKLISVGSRDSS